MSLSGANAIIMFAVTGVFPVPQQLQGFAADDIFTSGAIPINETLMGVDGKLSGGFVNVPIKQNYALQGDSASNAIFDAWYLAQKATQDTFVANAVITLTTINQVWALTKGFLTSYTPIPDVKKLIQPRHYEITWESITTAPI